MSRKKDVRVLIAEDDYLVSKMIRELLEDREYVVVGEAANSVEAVEMTQSLRPDVVLMDIKMPDMNGIEATQLIYERCPTPVVVLTAYDTEELVERASAAGVGAYLVKPPNVPEVERAIAIAMARFGDMMKLRDYAGQLEQRVRERTTQLQAQYARLDAILRSTADGIVVTDGQGEIIQANPVAQAWLTQTLSPEDAARLREGVRDLARQATAEAAGTGAMGEERPGTVLALTGLDLELKAAPISPPPSPPRNRGGREGGEAVVVDIHDVSHLKALDRMKARFVTNISHELRTPITTIKLCVELMRRRPLEKWEKYPDMLAQEVDRLARLVQDILQISHIDTGRLEIKPRPTVLDELAKSTITSHRALAQERRLTLEHCPAKRGPVALVDPQRMTQVLDNLVGNAIRYTPEGGKVIVSIGQEEAEERLWATVTVADTGIGIPEEELPHVFDRFFRGEVPRAMQLSGTGLGLAIVKEIVEAHGGRVTVESEVDVGTTFTIWLPLLTGERVGAIMASNHAQEDKTMAGITVQEIFERIAGSDPTKLQGINGVILFDLSGEGGGKWTLTLADGEVKLEEGEATSPSVTLSMAAQDFVAMTSGELNAVAAFMQGKIKVSGDMSLAMRLQNILT